MKNRFFNDNLPLLVQAVIWISLCIEIHFDSFITSGACGFTRLKMAYNFVSSLFTEHLQENIAIHHHQKQDLRIISAFAEHKILLHLHPLHQNHTQVYPDAENSALQYYRGRFYKSFFQENLTLKWIPLIHRTWQELDKKIASLYWFTNFFVWKYCLQSMFILCQLQDSMIILCP